MTTNISPRVSLNLIVNGFHLNLKLAVVFTVTNSIQVTPETSTLSKPSDNIDFLQLVGNKLGSRAEG
jgi:hypothetical protein